MKSVPASLKRLVALSLFLAITVALPLFVWTALNVNFNLNKKAQGEPNFCGGTCGSNFNCQANLFCYNGFCRNPICSDDIDCICNTATPTTVATNKTTSTFVVTATPSPSIMPKGGDITPQPIIEEATPEPTSTESLPPFEAKTTLENQFLLELANYTILGAFIVILFTFILLFKYNKKKKNTDIPHIVPPQNI